MIKKARSAKKSSRHPRNSKPGDHGFRNHRNNRQEEGAGESQSSQGVLEKFRGRLSRPIAGNVSVVFFKIIRDLSRLKLNRHPEIAEEEYQSRGQEHNARSQRPER